MELYVFKKPDGTVDGVASSVCTTVDQVDLVATGDNFVYQVPDNCNGFILKDILLRIETVENAGSDPEISVGVGEGSEWLTSAAVVGAAVEKQVFSLAKLQIDNAGIVFQPGDIITLRVDTGSDSDVLLAAVDIEGRTL